MKKTAIIFICAISLTACATQGGVARLKGNHHVFQFKKNSSITTIKYVAHNRSDKKHSKNMAMWLSAKVCLKQNSEYFEILSQELLRTQQKKAKFAVHVNAAEIRGTYSYVEQVIRCRAENPNSKYFSAGQVVKSLKAEYPTGFRFVQ